MTTATIGGFPCLGSSAVTWVLRAGTKPYVGDFDMHPKDAAELFSRSSRGTPVELVLSDGVTTRRVQNLWVLQLVPGESEHIVRVRLADRRWMWSHALVVGFYNIPRHVGQKRITATNERVLQPVVPRLQYAAWSLTVGKDGNSAPWDARTMLQDVIRKAESVSLGGPAPVRFEDGGVRDIPVQDLRVTENGDAAVARALGYLSPADVYVDDAGAVVVYNRATGREAQVLNQLGAEIVARGHAEIVDSRLLRPRTIEVYFVREIELRFDFAEAGGQTQVAGEEPRSLDNVAPVPDFTLEIGDKKHPTGEYLTFDELFAAWGNLPQPHKPGTGPPLSHSLLQKAMVPFMDLKAVIGLVGTFDPNADWSGRLSACDQHYRQTFRINQAWMARIRSIRPYRVATVDPTTGSRGPATAWADHCKLSTTRAMFKNIAHGLEYAVNVDGLESAGAELGDDKHPAPAHVSIPDPDQGIIHLAYEGDPLRHYEMILPSKLSGAPCGNLRDRGRPLTFDSITNGNMTQVKLSANFVMAVIVTVVPAAPSGLDQFHKITVSPDMVASLVAQPIGPCLGPVMQIFVGIETARIRWLDSRKTDIEKAFGQKGGNPNLSGLVLNEGDPSSGDGDGASLWAIAKGTAARVWGGLVDRYQGDKTGALTGVVPQGWADEVRHEVATSGEVTTHVRLPDRVPEVNLLSLMPAHVRNHLMKLVQP